MDADNAMDVVEKIIFASLHNPTLPPLILRGGEEGLAFK
jgi:hypothetical protein